MDKHKIIIFIGSLTGFVLGVVGNLLAAWIQHDLLKDSFTPMVIVTIVLSTIAGLLLTAYFIKFNEKRPNVNNSQKGNFFMSNALLLWSRITSKGKDITINDIATIGSEINVNTTNADEDN